MRGGQIRIPCSLFFSFLVRSWSEPIYIHRRPGFYTLFIHALLALALGLAQAKINRQQIVGRARRFCPVRPYPRHKRFDTRGLTAPCGSLCRRFHVSCAMNALSPTRKTFLPRISRQAPKGLSPCRHTGERAFRPLFQTARYTPDCGAHP